LYQKLKKFIIKKKIEIVFFLIFLDNKIFYSMKIINYTRRDELQLIKSLISFTDNNYNFIIKLVDKLMNDNLDAYRYGTSWMDKYITNYRIKKLNKLIQKKYNILVV
jgi:hypothetical protein